MPKTDWLKISSKGRPIGVDRENNVLQGYIVALEGSFKSTGRGEFDKKSLQAITKMMNSNPGGTKSRFTHPDMSNDGLGKFLGRAKRASLDTATVIREGEKVEVSAVRADLHFDPSAFETPHGDLASYVMGLAETDPEAISSSLVLTVDEEFRLEPDGTRKKDKAGNPLPPLWRPKAIHATDIVDTGDAVDGLLSHQLNTDSLPLGELWQASQLTNQFLEENFQGASREEIEARLSAWLKRYLDRKFGEIEPGPEPEPEPLGKPLELFKRKLLLQQLTIK